MYHLVKQHIRKITKELATQHFLTAAVDGDRGVKEAKIASRHRRKIHSGLFGTCRWIVCFCEEDQKTHRVDGGNTSKVFMEPDTPLIRSDGTQYECLYQWYNAETLDDLTLLSTQSNSKYSSRETGDSFRVYGGRMEALVDASDPVIGFIVNGLAFAKYGLDYSTLSEAESRGELLFGRNKFCEFARAVIDASPRQTFIRKPAVVAAMVESFDTHPKAARIFWETVQSGNNPKPGSTERRLQDYLRENRAGNNKKKKQDVMRRCGRDWRRWYTAWKKKQDRTTSVIPIGQMPTSTRATKRSAPKHAVAAKKGLK